MATSCLVDFSSLLCVKAGDRITFRFVPGTSGKVEWFLRVAQGPRSLRNFTLISPTTGGILSKAVADPDASPDDRVATVEAGPGFLSHELQSMLAHSVDEFEIEWSDGQPVDTSALSRPGARIQFHFKPGGFPGAAALTYLHLVGQVKLDHPAALPGSIAAGRWDSESRSGYLISNLDVEGRAYFIKYVLEHLDVLRA
jgi:hypothetical protein